MLTNSTLESFAGVAYPFIADVIKKGATVVDIGSGFGVDAIIAGLKTGPDGKVYGIDITETMIQKVRQNVKMGLNYIHILESQA